MHIELDRRRFEFYPEVTASLRRIGEKIAEVPISYNLRSAAEEKKSPRRWLAGDLDPDPSRFLPRGLWP